MPGSKYTTDGFCKTDVVPLPRSHFHEVGFPTDESANLTTTGAQPPVVEELKSAFICAFAENTHKRKRENKAGYFDWIKNTGKNVRFFKVLNLDS